MAAAGMKHRERTYRDTMRHPHLVGFQVTVKETDLHIQAERQLTDITRELVMEYRGYIEAYIQQHPDFVRAMTPWLHPSPAPRIIQAMATAAGKAGVGPMAAVAGAIAESVGADLLAHSSEIIVENGGDIFIRLNSPALIGIYAGSSPLSMKIGIRLAARPDPVGICTSSGTVGHSISFGSADAVCVISPSCALADAAATAVGNRVCKPSDIGPAIQWGQRIQGVDGIVIIKKDKIGAWGEIEVVPL